jgi:dynein heavy chain
MYPFSLGDLRDAANCLNNYMENAPSQIPWADLKYLFGEIIYGGHIVNDGDRLLANTYLDFYMRDELLGIMEMFPFVDPTVGLSFRSMQPSTHENYNKYLEDGKPILINIVIEFIKDNKSKIDTPVILLSMAIIFSPFRSHV